ncbi:hypothetical protein VNO80_22258 [Phaseolus coccineus]|uniref:Secreted protein n=1 Tax=Phaseolus coccineus TaxID=3886 RepID=A0AAN9QU35_PHACN
MDLGLRAINRWKLTVLLPELFIACSVSQRHVEVSDHHNTEKQRFSDNSRVQGTRSISKNAINTTKP